MTAKCNAIRDYYRRSYFAILLLLTVILSSKIAYGFDLDVEADFEPVDQYRRRMGISYGYKTRVLSAESCRDYSERECEEMEDSFIEQAANLRRLQDDTRSGDINVVVLLIRFSDHPNRNLPLPEDIEVLFNDPGTTDLITPTGSVKTYLAKNSYDKLRINAIVSDTWVDAAGTELSCAGSNKGRGDQMMDCFAPALDAMEKQSGVCWWDLDLDGEGSLDAVIVLHSGYSTSQGQTDEDGVDKSLRIQSHARTANPRNAWKSPSSGLRLGNYVVESGYRGAAGQEITRINVISHEFLHLLGAIDIYDTSFLTRGAGAFALMSHPYGHTGTLDGAITPGHVSPWVKMKLGWVTPIEITHDGTYLARASLTTTDIYMISAPYPDGEYLLIENRPAIEWDAALRGGGGIVIWSINDNIDGNTKDGQEVVVLQADELFDLENNRGFGNEGDFWVTGRELKATGPVSTKSRITGAENGIRIYDFSPPGSLNSYFTVENLAPAPPTTSPTAAPVEGTTAPSPIPMTTAPSTQDTTTAPAETITAAPTVQVPATAAPVEPPTAAPVEPPTAAPVEPPTAAPVQDITTAPITAAPTPAATAAPVQTPALPPGECFVSINPGDCSPLMALQEPIENCECYNFCNGEPTCCKFGESCVLTCSGNFVGGCKLEPDEPEPLAASTPQPTSTPTKAPTPKQSFFFWVV
jgi:M6 family metalloprotease-like protein